MAIAPTMAVAWDARHQCHVLRYPDGAVQLNPSAAMILRLCDGQHTLAQITVELRAQFPEAPELPDDVMEFVQTALARGWITLQKRPAN